MTNIPPRRFGSLAAAMVTPMTASGDIDLVSAQRLATKLVDEGCDTILLSGTTGESPTTHQPEKNDLTSGQLRVWVGVDDEERQRFYSSAGFAPSGAVRAIGGQTQHMWWAQRD